MHPANHQGPSAGVRDLTKKEEKKEETKEALRVVKFTEAVSQAARFSLDPSFLVGLTFCSSEFFDLLASAAAYRT